MPDQARPEGPTTLIGVTSPTFETASWARRVVALLVDWLASTLVVILIIQDAYFETGSRGSFLVLGVYVVESALLTALVGGSFGKLATRLRVVRVDGDPRPIGLLQALMRSVLIALVIPPLVYRPDGRGLHDILAGSATVDLQTWRRLAGR
ncbi:RDD family protein [Nocardioides lianchengensis]|uniref:RDD family protein n=1 Tax=Nocardioides lianchengensis TaxID=1045774 RepID=A0A1G6YX44_9ACTN|nr:RDD family protein [Nocardioides lianchengensis]